VAKVNSAGQWLWAVRAGGKHSDVGFSIALDSGGNAYLTGYFGGTAEFGATTLTSAGSDDIFVAKMDSAGQWLWAVRAGGASEDRGNSIALDSKGNAYLTGYFREAAAFGATTLISAGGENTYVAKVNSAGQWFWAVRAGGTIDDRGNSIALDSSGNTYLAGYFRQKLPFGATTLSAGSTNIYMAKMDSARQWLWAVSAYSVNHDFVYSIAVDSGDNAYLTGSFSGTTPFGATTITSAGGDDIYVAKVDSAGQWLWAVRAGGTSDDIGNSIAVDSGSNAYIVGYFQGTAAFGAITLTSAGNDDIFVAKVDSVGQWLWAARAGGTSMDRGNSITLDNKGNAYITGYFSGTAAFGATTLTSAGGNDIYMAKMNSAGQWLWAVRAGGIGNDRGNSLALDSGGNAYLTGYFNSTAAFGATTLTSTGSDDIFVAKVDSVGQWLWAARAGGTSEERGNGIVLDSGGNAYLTGYFRETAAFGATTLTSAGGNDIYMAKMDSAGQWLWAVRAGSISNDVGNSIALDSGGNAYVSGYFSGTAEFGAATFTSASSYDIFVAKVVDGAAYCADQCVDISSNSQHCGKCGNACSTNQKCQDGICK
jgi:hypothetical protein